MSCLVLLLSIIVDMTAVIVLARSHSAANSSLPTFSNRFNCLHIILWVSTNSISIWFADIFFPFPPPAWTGDNKVANLVGMHRKATLTGQVIRVVFLCKKHYLMNENMNVSNAIMNIPKAIRSWKVKRCLSMAGSSPFLKFNHNMTKLVKKDGRKITNAFARK